MCIVNQALSEQVKAYITYDYLVRMVIGELVFILHSINHLVTQSASHFFNQLRNCVVAQYVNQS
jgi:hypothetical protein